MNIAQFSIEKRVISFVTTTVVIAAGLLAFNGMSRLEDPEFTIKDALVITPYPGANAREVEEEVTDVIERAAQQLGQIKRVESRSERGLSTVTVTIQDQYGKEALPQVWDELRRKVNDAQGQLPPGAGPSIVNDDYGDVYGIYYALISREKIAQFGISKQVIYDALASKNLVADAGNAEVAGDYIPLEATGEFKTVDDFGGLLVTSGDGGRLVFLRDVATVRRGYVDPPSHLLRYGGEPAYGLAISTAQGGNVVSMGENVKARIAELELSGAIPFGVELHPISMQSDAVTVAINGFVISLIEAIVIVLAVLFLFMGVRSGFIIGFVLFVTICATFLVMGAQGIILERISLGALIIALGMLVDNAIVVTEGMLIKIQSGEDKMKAAKSVVGQTMVPLLGATVIAVLAFAAIGTSQDNTGEYCRSLFQVILISLLISWITAITLTPLLCYVLFKKPEGAAAAGQKDPYAGAFYRVYKNFLVFCIRRRWLTLGATAAMLGLAVVGFGRVEQSFFPNSTRPQFIVDVWLKSGTHIDTTTATVEQVEDYLAELEHVTGLTSIIGRGANRFLLTYTPEKPDTSYAQLLVDVDNYSVIDGMMDAVQAKLASELPEAMIMVKTFVLGPSKGSKIQVRFSGPDRAVLRTIAQQASDIMHDAGGVRNVRTDWRDQVKAISAELSEPQAQNAGIDRPLLAATLHEAFDGFTAGVFRENDKLIPIISRPPLAERNDIAQLQNLQIWSPVAGRMIPVKQVVQDFVTRFENPILVRRDRATTITVMSDPIAGNASVQFARLRPMIEAIEMPSGYKLEWGGEYEDSKNAQAGLAASLPLFIGMMVIITIFLFNSLRQPLVIWLCVPLALIGITAGLLVAGQPFGFMALLGALSLIGMLIKNAIVLIDQINLEKTEGKSDFDAIVSSGVSRMRPVMMAASTTVLGLIPLLMDAFFVSLAVTIMAGLAFASVLTLIVVPVLYATIYGVRQTA